MESRIESNLGSLYMGADSTVMPEIIWSRHISITKRVPEEERSLASLTAIYNNLALCYMRKSGSLEKAENISQTGDRVRSAF